MTLVSTLHHICARRTRWANLHAGEFLFFTLLLEGLLNRFPSIYDNSTSSTHLAMKLNTLVETLQLAQNLVYEFLFLVTLGIFCVLLCELREFLCETYTMKRQHVEEYPIPVLLDSAQVSKRTYISVRISITLSELI